MYIAKWYCLNLAVLDPNSKYTEQDYYDFDHKCTTIISQDSSNKYCGGHSEHFEFYREIQYQLINF